MNKDQYESLTPKVFYDLMKLIRDKKNQEMALNNSRDPTKQDSGHKKGNKKKRKCIIL